MSFNGTYLCGSGPSAFETLCLSRVILIGSFFPFHISRNVTIAGIGFLTSLNSVADGFLNRMSNNPIPYSPSLSEHILLFFLFSRRLNLFRCKRQRVTVLPITYYTLLSVQKRFVLFCNTFNPKRSVKISKLFLCSENFVMSVTYSAEGRHLLRFTFLLCFASISLGKPIYQRTFLVSPKFSPC